MYTLGIDLGSSSVKASIMDVETGKSIASATYPDQEMEISSPQHAWAEQNPEDWWQIASLAIQKAIKKAGIHGESIAAIGIAYQMHGLVIVDKDLKPLRPSIIWCDSRAIRQGDVLFNKVGKEKCLDSLLNSPGNFTMSKLLWVKENEPELFNRIFKMMLPGDYLALRLTGDLVTTASGLSEGIMWDFSKDLAATFLLEAAGVDSNLLPETLPTFGYQGSLTAAAASLLGLKAGTPVSYRAGDQPNNAFSLNVLEPGEVAATAGTSGVVYGVTDKKLADKKMRVNTFAHVNHNKNDNRLGVLLCINGTGIANAWIRRMTGALDYPSMNKLAEGVKPGADGLTFLPFGNGAERMLENKMPGAGFHGLDLNIHKQAHLYRAVQEGIACAFRYGMEIMRESGIALEVIRAGHNNMFLSKVFCNALSALSGASIQLYDTDGALGAARGAALGAGIYASFQQAFKQLEVKESIKSPQNLVNEYESTYRKWKNALESGM